MFVFTPNTLIKSSEINDNFDEVTASVTAVATRATNLETPSYYNGDIGAEITANTYKSLGGLREIYSGITKTNSTTLTVTVAGIYYINIQQLISATTGAGYLAIRINNTSVTFGYYEASTMDDTGCSVIKSLAVNDTIRVHQSAAITNSWSAEHSNIDVYCMKRT